ncbi:MAG TPA: Fe-S protein assembly co-chaperone HscB [Verrucomicrobiae bacterium]|jgi:molecular chaperone HscB|nr:Fe-S protein assembly co-chaperone HscB [Verrucomicrobiae bacterium]
MDDYFAVFELPRKLTVDGEALRRRFYELSRVHHPDFHQGADEAVQAATLARSALVNRAYRALRDPIRRVEYLIALEEGRDTREGSASRPKAPRDLLEEMLEVQEALEEARAGELDESARERLRGERERLAARRQAEDDALVGRAAEWDAAVDAGGDRQPLLTWFKERLAARAYLRTVIDDLSDALGEDQEQHVSHRRH